MAAIAVITPLTTTVTLTSIITGLPVLLPCFSSRAQIPFISISSLVPQHLESTGRVGIVLCTVAYGDTEMQRECRLAQGQRVNQGKMWELKLELQIFQGEMGLAYTWVTCIVPR